MEEITTMLKNLQKDISQQRIEIKNMKDEISNPIIEIINTKFKEIMSKNEQLEEIIHDQQEKIENLEKQVRMKNIVLFGFEENEKSYEDLEKTIIKFFHDYLQIECATYDIESATRLGRKGDKIRPIKISFSKLSTKIKILKNKKKLEKTSYYIKQDFSPQIIEKRKELQKEVDVARKQGKNAVLRSDKIVYLDERKNYNRSKRKPSNSPEYSRDTKRQGNITSVPVRASNQSKMYMTNFFSPKEKGIIDLDSSSSTTQISTKTRGDTQTEL